MVPARTFRVPSRRIVSGPFSPHLSLADRRGPRADGRRHFTRPHERSPPRSSRPAMTETGLTHSPVAVAVRASRGPRGQQARQPPSPLSALMSMLLLSVVNEYFRSRRTDSPSHDTWTVVISLLMEEDDYQWWTEEDLWKFPPPPPRPPFLEPPYPDGLTTCDLCTWALQPLDGTDNGMLTVPIAEVTWPMILVLVSLLSAAIGALFMVVFLHLKLRLSGRTAPSRPECLVSFDPPTDRVHHHHHHQQLHHHQRQIAQIAAGDQYHLNHMNHLNHLNNLNNRRAGPIVRRSGGPDGTASKHNGPGRPSGGGDGGGGGARNRGDGGGGGGGVGGGGGDDAGGGGGGVGQLSVNPGDWFRWFRRKRGAVLPPDAVPSNQNAVRANHYTVEEAAAAIPVMVYASVIGGGPEDHHHHHHHQQPPPSSVVNDDVLYTELDRVPTPAYHNAGYAFDQHSSAYYSDMYEPIDPYHHNHLHHNHQRQNSLPSDYV